MSIFVSGLLNIETNIKIKSFPIEYQSVDYNFFGINSFVSGVGYNIAKALSTLGSDIFLYSLLGSDFQSTIIKEELKKQNINDCLIENSLKSTPVSVNFFDDQGKRMINCDLKDIQETPPNLNDQLIKQLKLSTLAVLCNINFNRPLLKIAKDNNIKIATDVHVLSSIDDQYNQDFIKNADILFLSDENITDKKHFILSLFEKYNNEIIVLSLGKDGALILLREENKLIKMDPIIQENVVNTVGAGDALFAAFIHFYTKTSNPLTSLFLAQNFASAKIAHNGASEGFLDEASLIKYANNHKLNITLL